MSRDGVIALRLFKVPIFNIYGLEMARKPHRLTDKDLLNALFRRLHRGVHINRTFRALEIIHFS